MIGSILIIFCVKNQAPQVSFKFVAGDSMSTSSGEFTDIKYCDFMDILKDISYYRAYKFALLSFMSCAYMITCSSPHSKYGYLFHSLGHFLLTPRADFTSHCLMFKYATS